MIFSRTYVYSPRKIIAIRQLLVPVFFFLVVVCSACQGGDQSGKEKGEIRTIVIESKAGKVSINAEFARTPSQQQQGLMYRKELKDGDGMLFIFEKDDVLSFWMKNTIIPLSIAYIGSDGRILDIYDMEPENLNPVRSSRSVRYALEVPVGWFTRAGIALGDKLDTGNL